MICTYLQTAKPEDSKELTAGGCVGAKVEVKYFETDSSSVEKNSVTEPTFLKDALLIHIHTYV